MSVRARGAFYMAPVKRHFLIERATFSCQVFFHSLNSKGECGISTAAVHPIDVPEMRACTGCCDVGSVLKRFTFSA